MNSEQKPEDDIISITEDDLENVDTVVVNEIDFVGTTNTPASGKINWQPELNTSSKEAVDIVLCIDTSGSMGANDYTPDRLTAAKESAKLFAQKKVLKNYNDRVGIVGFGGIPHTTFQITNSLDQIPNAIDRLQITHSGTMIGNALKAAEDMLEKTKGNKRAIILLSDGGDSYDTSKPIEVAKSLDQVVIFTIGIGTQKGTAKLPHGHQQVPLNQDLLQKVAKATGGEYVYAPDLASLQRIYSNLADY
jgi:Ca-activated chloride channel homolog